MDRFTGRIFATALMVLASVGGALAWGAIAVDDEPGQDPESVGWGMVTGEDSRGQAATDAMDACRTEGNDDCRPALTFEKCGAYATSALQYGVGVATSLKQAEQRALASCAEPDCRIVVSDCE